MRDTMSDTHQTTDVESWPQTGFFSGLAGMAAAPASLGHLTSDTVLIVILSFAILLLPSMQGLDKLYRLFLHAHDECIDTAPVIAITDQ